MSVQIWEASAYLLLGVSVSIGSILFGGLHPSQAQKRHLMATLLKHIATRLEKRQE